MTSGGAAVDEHILCLLLWLVSFGGVVLVSLPRNSWHYLWEHHAMMNALVQCGISVCFSCSIHEELALVLGWQPAREEVFTPTNAHTRQV